MIYRVHQQSIEMDCQLWWRFLDFDAWPLRMTRMVDPRYGSNRAELLADELYKTNACCLDDHMSLKSRDLFGTYLEMSSDAEFIAMVPPEPEVGRGRGPKGDRYDRILIGCGKVTLNKSNMSLDAECSACGSSKDRRWYARANAKSPGTLAQGRP